MKIRWMVCLAGLISILGAIPSSASTSGACSGSGTTWSCPSGASLTDVQTALNSAADGAVITFAAGSYNWSGTWVQFSMTKGATLICASVGACSVTESGTILGMNGPTGTSNKFYRISGFSFSTSNTGQAIVWFDACNPSCQPLYLTQFRMDHNTFSITGAGTVLFIGDNYSNTFMYGVVDHNTLNSSNASALVFWIGQKSVDPDPPTVYEGTSKNLFVEDNTVTITTNTDASVPCFSDAWGNATYVFRHNTITNCSTPVHGIDHGGPMNMENYNNRYILNSGASTIGISDGYHMWHHQGSGEELYFNNTFTTLTTPANSATMSAAVESYMDGVCSGYPCLYATNRAPQPGRALDGSLRPIYAWNNVITNDGSEAAASIDGNSDVYLAPNRDLFNAVSASEQTSQTSPFNGTVGMGYGTLANMPTTCTHSNATHPTLSADGTLGGVGYAVHTTNGTIGAAGDGLGVASDDVLYHCGTTNTWTVYYTPYTYPHPLTTGGAGAPAPPQGLQANVN